MLCLWVNCLGRGININIPLHCTCKCNMSKSGDDTARNLKHYLESEHSVVEPISSKKDDKPKKVAPKNTDTDTYDYSDDDKGDDTKW